MSYKKGNRVYYGSDVFAKATGGPPMPSVKPPRPPHDDAGDQRKTVGVPLIPGEAPPMKKESRGFCVDCMYCMKTAEGYDCMHWQTADLVTGVPGTPCDRMRFDGACGPHGDLWERRQSRPADADDPEQSAPDARTRHPPR